jgi:hypothetical protein
VDAHPSTSVVGLNAGWNAHSIVIVDLSAEVMPTQETYDQLQTGYGYFNGCLFENSLPNCLITLQRRGRTYGYYAPDRFSRNDGLRTDEIALNPHYFRDGTKEILSTLIHEMVHVWQHHCGKPGRGGYHNSEWAEKMRSLGLQASNTGKEGGKGTGDAMDHYVLPDGLFARAVEQLLAGGYEITWAEVTGKKPSSSPDTPGSYGTGQAGDRGSQSGKRTKFSCPAPHCNLNAWAKASAVLLCGEHMERMKPASRLGGN